MRFRRFGIYRFCGFLLFLLLLNVGLLFCLFDFGNLSCWFQVPGSRVLPRVLV